MLKIKHQRTADCVVAGFRWHKNGPGTHIGSLLLGLFDDEGRLHHVGITSSFSWDRREALATELAPLREDAIGRPPVAGMGRVGVDGRGRRFRPAPARRDEPLEPGQGPVLGAAPRRNASSEVAYDHLQGDRFRHATTFQRWRPDKPPADCRYDQLEETPAYEIAKIFGG